LKREKLKTKRQEMDPAVLEHDINVFRTLHFTKIICNNNKTNYKLKGLGPYLKPFLHSAYYTDIFVSC